MRKKLSKFATGSKLVFLTADREVNHDYYIINEKDGHWVNGIWWSNSSYKWQRNYGGLYTSGWSKTSYTPSYSTETAWALGSVEDCTYLDENGLEVWGELWTCGLCDHQEYYNEASINSADWCPNCQSCWYCSGDRFSCECYYTPEDDGDRVQYVNPYHPENQKLLAVGNYDGACDIDEMGF
jgi:hypothetical protein